MGIVEKSRVKYLRAQEHDKILYQTFKNAEKAYQGVKEPNWIEFLVQPIADYVAEAIPEAEVRVEGPLGMGLRAYIFVDLVKDGAHYFSGIALALWDRKNGILKIVDYSNVTQTPQLSVVALEQYLDLPEGLDDLVKAIKSKFSPK